MGDGILEAGHGVEVGVGRNVANVALHKELSRFQAQHLVGLHRKNLLPTYNKFEAQALAVLVDLVSELFVHIC